VRPCPSRCTRGSTCAWQRTRTAVRRAAEATRARPSSQRVV
jgi:hypothetical protein